MNDIQRYLDEIVEPTIAEFGRDRTSRRRAFLACVVTLHAIDYLSPKRRNLRKRFRNECKSFSIVDRVCHAFKHVKTGHLNDPHFQPLTERNVISWPSAVPGQFTPGSTYPGAAGGVTLTGHPNVDLLIELGTAVRFLRAQAATLKPPASSSEPLAPRGA